MAELIYQRASDEIIIVNRRMSVLVDGDLHIIIKPVEPSTQSKWSRLLHGVIKAVSLLTCLYFFVVSLNLMSTSFPLIAGKYASEAFRSNVVLTNPLAGLMIGILATVVVQSSSTSTSIIVSMVASEIIPVKFAIPIIMGSNVGTSITSTLVALSHAMDKEKFRLSFAGATVHDMFNILTVAVLLPVELATSYLERLSGILVTPIKESHPGAKEPELLNAIVKPLTDAIIQIDKNLLDKIATNQTTDDVSLIKRLCSVDQQANTSSETNMTTIYKPCRFLFNSVNWPDWVVGTLLLLVSLVGLCCCLIFMVKILTSIFNGPVAKFIQTIVNSDLPGIFKHFTGLLAIIVGGILTMLVQSSSVFTSSLTPLVGMGLVSLERVYPLTLGANMGTTVTGILASISGPAKTLKFSLQIALCHTLFNLSGILLWYPVPQMKHLPIRMARFLGNTTAEYRWFAIAYLIGMFFLLPIAVFTISMLGKVVFMIVLGLSLAIIFGVVFLNLMQHRFPSYLPDKLKDWLFLPPALRSLKPYDEFINNYLCCLNCCRKLVAVAPDSNKAEDKAKSSLNDIEIGNGKDKHQNHVLITTVANTVEFSNKAFAVESF